MNRTQREQEVRRAARRVGVTSENRLAWAIAFAQRSPETMTQGDWVNAQSELAALLGAEPGSPLELLWPVGRRETEVAQRTFRRVLDAAVRRRDVPLGRHELFLDWLPWPRSSPPRGMARWPPGDGRYSLIHLDRKRPAAAALHRLGQDLELAGHFLKACPAPAPRGKPTESCGRWFIQRRPQQAYCSPQCQSRASTRAYRAEREKRPPRRRR